MNFILLKKYPQFYSIENMKFAAFSLRRGKKGDVRKRYGRGDTLILPWVFLQLYS
jgi:hypothetical protein